MTLRQCLVVTLVACAILTANALDNQPLEHFEALCGSQTLPKPLFRRQKPVIVVPPTGFRTPLIPQPTTSLNYWWPYGPNGVNPTLTVAPPPPSSTSSIDEMDIVDETSTEEGIATSTGISFSSTSRSTSTTATKTTASGPLITETDSVEASVPQNGAFKVDSLLPLFIILGVLLVATLVGWTYGRCTHWYRCRREPVLGGPDIGGNPYKCGKYGSNDTGPTHSLSVGWVDASRIHSQYNSRSRNYHVIQTDPLDEKYKILSTNKHPAQEVHGWLRCTRSGRRYPRNSYMSLSYADSTGATSQHYSLPFSTSLSPKSLQVIKGSSSTVETGAQSPTTDTQPTSYFPAFRHASIRRKIVSKAYEDDCSNLLVVTAPVRGFRRSGDENKKEPLCGYNRSVLEDELCKQYSARRYSPAPPSQMPPTWSPNPEIHRSRMRRLRAAAQFALPISDSSRPSKFDDIIHPLPPAPAVLLSPHLQPHLFFASLGTENSKSDNDFERTTSPFVHSNVSRDLNSRSIEPQVATNDLFGPSGTSYGQNRRARPQKVMGSTETIPLSPELRGAAMTRLEELMKSNWSIRNLAGAPQSPTLFGALSPPSGNRAHTAYARDDYHAGIEEALLANPLSDHV